MEQPASERSAALTDNQAKSRFEIHVGGELAGFVRYKRSGDVITLVHTEVGEAFQGAGLAGQLARFSLDTAREQQLSVLPACPYVRSWIERHPDYVDLVPADRRAGFGLGES